MHNVPLGYHPKHRTLKQQLLLQAPILTLPGIIQIARCNNANLHIPSSQAPAWLSSTLEFIFIYSRTKVTVVRRMFCRCGIWPLRQVSYLESSVRIYQTFLGTP